MRRYLLVLTAAAALGAGCAAEDANGQPGPSTAPGGPAAPGEVVADADPVALIGSWTLAEVADERDSVIRVAPGEIRVWRDCAILHGGWRANEYGQFVASIGGYSGDCGGAPADTPDWLSRATSFEVDGEARVLRDAAGEVVARLLPGAEPTPGPNLAPEFAEPPAVTDEARRALAPAVGLPGDLAPVDAGRLAGRWVPEGSASGDAAGPYLDLAADGSWQGSDGCNGQSGRWLAGPAGAMLATSGASTMIGCDNVPVGGWLAGASRAGFDGDVLVLLDAQGAELGRLQPA